ncbi:MAG: tripartite tricarboxylate transporter substrate binding protein [Candidatus Parcubacteria bacterium]|nr:tripartite tricarboxylate transporter substrate binding protein [Burkholderiales bacterium]
MRLLLAEMSKQMGVAFVVENKPGASFVLGTMDIVRAPADGYTLGYGNIVSLAVNRSLLEKVPYDVERDLSLISNCVRVYNMLAVNNSLPVRTVPELIALAKRSPGRLTMASSGNGTTGHLGGELFKAMSGTFILHVPYRGSAQAINDLIGGQVQLMFDNVPSIGPHAKAGRVRAVAVSGPRRSAVFPEIPTVAEAGLPGYETIAWGGIVGPANLPREIVARLQAEIRTAYASPALQERYRNLDTEIDGGTPEQFLALVRSETPKWAAVVKRSGAKVD